MKKRYLLFFLIFITVGTGKLFSQGSTFTFATTGTNAQIDTALAFTGRIWGEFLNSDVPIKVHVYYLNLFGSTLAITIPNGERDFPSAALDSVWYPSCLANAMEGVELNPGEDDMNIFVDSTHNWYFGLDAVCPPGKYDFVSIILHEIGHGLGFLSLAKMEDTVGSFGRITTADIAPLVTTFPFPDLQGKYSIFSSFMENGTGQSLVDTLLFPNPSVALGDQFTSNSVYFKGPLAMAQNSGNHVRLFAPAVYEPGSSMEHLNEATFPANNPNTLMTPYSGTSEEHHHPGWLAVAMLEDIGWNVNHDVGMENIVPGLRMEIFPNPVHELAYIRPGETVQGEKMEIIDLYGKVVYSQYVSIDKGASYPIDLSQLASGIYLVKIKGGLFKLIKS